MLRARRASASAPVPVWVGVAIALAAAWSLSACSDPADRADGTDPARPSIVLITIDTPRADHLDVYGYERPTAPHIRRLAERGVRFEYALSQAPWTLPAMATLMTSRYPFEHGAIRADRKLNHKFVTLAEALRDAGYHTIGVVSHKFVSRSYGLAQGFIEFDESQVKDDDALTSAALSRIAAKRVTEAPRPFFLWVHYYDPHYSYVRHSNFDFADFAPGYEGPLSQHIEWTTLERMKKAKQLTPEDMRYIEAIYDEEIAHTDRFIGQLVDGIEALGLEEEVAYIVTSDHGEYFMERGRFFHGKDLYDELLHVPLIIAGAIGPERKGRVVSSPVETRSIPATIMEIAGVDQHPFRGANLLSVDSSGSSAPYVFSEGSHAWNDHHDRLAVVGRGWKLIYRLKTDRYELYDLASDPKEKDDRYAAQDAAVSQIRDELRRALDEFASAPAHEGTLLEMTKEHEEELRALGYAR